MARQRLAVLAAALIIGSAAAAAQSMPTDPTAAANVRASRQYEQAVDKNSSFRTKRLQEECGPITDPELHASCVSSFNMPGK